MNPNAEPSSARASTKQNQNPRGHRDSTAALVLLRRVALNLAETVAPSRKTQPPRRRSLQLMPLPLPVCIFYLFWASCFRLCADSIFQQWPLTLTIAAAAARINASLQARKGIQHVDVPPIRSADTESPPPRSTSTPQTSNKIAPPLDTEMYVADGDYIQDIEVNDLRNRYLLTKGATQKMVNTPDSKALMFPEALFRTVFCA